MMNKSIIKMPLVCVMVICFSSLSFGVNYYVSQFSGSNDTGDGSPGAPWATIQYAIDNSTDVSGEETNIHVDRGTYEENITLRSGIRLFGGYDSRYGWSRDVGRFVTNLQAEDASIGSNTVTMADDTRLDGFTITSGMKGVYCPSGSCIIVNNIIEDHEHYGVVVWSGATSYIEKNNIMRNKGGIYCSSNVSATIIKNTIEKNKEQGIYCYTSAPTIYRNMIRGNLSSGIYCVSDGDAVIVANYILENTVAGVFINTSDPIISQNFLSANGIGVDSRNQSMPMIDSNTINGSGGSGVYLKSAGAYIKNNIFANNTSYGIEEYNDVSDPDIDTNCFFMNLQADYYDEGTSPVIGADLINTIVTNAPFLCVNNIDGNPRFADTTQHNFHLTSGSACIDAGITPQFLFDIDLDDRPFDTPDVGTNGTDYDIGADEYIGTWDYEFTPDPEGWFYTNTVPVYSPATSIVGEGYIGLEATDWNCFSSWTSPANVRALPGYLHRVRFHIRSDSEDPSVVPGIRLRANRQSYTTSAELRIESRLGGENSPTTEGTSYTLYLEPLQGPISTHPDATDYLLLAFDILNFDPNDEPTGALFLDAVEVDLIGLESIEDNWSTETVYYFHSDPEGWQPGGAPSVFDLPDFSADIGALFMKAKNNYNTFGFWFSPPMEAEAGKFYRARFYVLSDQAVPSITPGFRMRLNSVNGHIGSLYNVSSLGQGESSPDKVELQVYTLYLAMRDHIETFIGSIDMLNFDPNDAANGSIILGHFTVDSCPLGLVH